MQAFSYSAGYSVVKLKNIAIVQTKSQLTQKAQWTNQRSKQIDVTGAKRGKTRAPKSFLIG